MNGNGDKNIFENGAVWLRADFHLHTKADKEFKYSGSKGDFCRLYIEQLKKQGIKIGVITNHNKFDKKEFKELKKEASNNRIWLLPGVEFSLKEGIHIIIVFDEAWYEGQESDYIDDFLKNAFYGINNPSNPPYPNSRFDLKKTVEELDVLKHNYFIVLAHVDADNGLFKNLKGRTREQFIEQEAFGKVLAVQKSGNMDNYNNLCDKSGRWIACVEGSDNAQAGTEGLGNGEKTYLKIGDFNFEALKYALKNPDRVKPKEPPTVRNSYIKSIYFEGGLLCGVKIDFSSGLNSLIGIRGSGKSAVLEILRYALSIPHGAKVMDKEYKDGLVECVLGSGGKVTIEIINEHEELYRIECIYGEKENIYKRDKLLDDITLDAIFNRWPIYFGQKDLSNKDVGFEGDLIEKIMGGRLNGIRKRIEDKKQEIKKIATELKTLEDLSELKKETETQKKDAEHKLKVFEEKGIADKLKLQTSFEMDINKVQSFKGNVDTYYIEELSNLIENNKFLIEQAILSSDFGTNKSFFEEINKQLEILKQEFSNLNVIFEHSKDISSNLEDILMRLISERDKFKEEFAKIKREINITNLDPDNYIKIKKELEISKIRLIEIDKSEAKRKKLDNQLKVSLEDLDKLWHEEFKILQEEARKINDSKTKLSVKVEYKACKNKFLTKLQNNFKGGGIRETVFKDVSNKCEDFIDIFKDGFQKLKTIITNEHQQSHFRKHFESDFYDLLTFRVADEVTINFEDRPLREHSLGQRASALILFLLAQKENNILIIDQPEDDLDNQTIYEDVIKEIKKIKGDMQFIFATHNANIPVLGDSEMIIACEYTDGRNIKVKTGSIDKFPIQEKVIRIMEGGKEAFEKRRKIYNIWNNEETK